MKPPKTMFVALLLLFMAGVALAQSTTAVSRWNIGGGGGTASGGNVTLMGAMGQGIAGSSSSGGNIVVSSGFWSGGPVRHAVYLPLVVRNFMIYAPVCGPDNRYCEDNDTWNQAYGPLQPGVGYMAYPDDAEDFYYVLLFNASQVIFSVTTYQASGWLIVYNEQYAEVSRKFVQNNQMVIGPSNLSPGKYYIRIYTSQPYNSTGLYTLTITQQ